MENIASEMSKYSVNQSNQTDKPTTQILAICSVPMQQWEQIYDEDTAFSAGTLFPGLNLPFLGGGK